MARKQIQGITIEIGGDTTKLQDALKGVEAKLKATQDALKDTNRLLKLDPGNVELLRQKQGQLTDAISGTEEKLKTLKDAAAQAEQQLADGTMTQAQYDTLQREIAQTEQDLKSLTGQMKEFGSVGAQQVAAVGRKMEEVGDKMTQVGTGMTKYVTAPIVAVGTAAVAAFNEVDEGLDIIVKKTGASGKALEEMEEAAKNLATSIPTDFRTAGEAVGEVNTRFGLTGKALEDLSGKFIKFAELNDTSVTASVDQVQAAMAAFGVSTDKAGNVLDILNKAAQDTGADVNTLTSDLTSNAAVLQEMGLRINSATGFLANLNKNGLDTRSVLVGMKKALQNATKEGKTMSSALREIEQSIIGAKSETKALQIATELFGAKSAPAMVKAIRSGRMSLADLESKIEDTGNSVDKTFEEMLDPIDQFKTTLNELKIVGMELVEAAAPLIKALAEGLRNAVQGLRNAWQGLSPQMQQTIIKIAGVAAAAGPLIAVGGKVVSGIGTLLTLGPKLVAAFNVVKSAFAALSGVLAANPIGLVIAAVGALVAALVTLYNKCEWFRNGVNAIGQGIMDGVTGFVDWFKNAMNGIGDFMGNLAQNALNWGRDLIQNFINGIKNMWEDAKRTVSNFAGMIKDFLGFSEPKKGPLSDFGSYAPDMVKLFTQGLKDNQQLVANQLAQTFGMPQLAGADAAGSTGAAREFTTPVTGQRPIDITFVIDGAKEWVYRANRDESQRVGIVLTD